MISLVARAKAAHAAGRLNEAQQGYLEALALDANAAEAWHGFGAWQFDMGDAASAEQSLRRALQLDARNDFALDLARLLRLRNRVAEAERCLRDALDRDPASGALLGALASLLHFDGRSEAAEPLFREALRHEPHHAQTRASYAMLLLQQGRFAEGWPLYESRVAAGPQRGNVALLDAVCPQWQGESLAGKSLLVWAEQGVGDNIQFVRYARLLKDQGVAWLAWMPLAETRELFESVDGIDEIVTRETRRKFDRWTLPLSVPLHLRTTLQTIPANLPYLRANADRVAHWQTRLPPGAKVGLVWRGAPKHNNDVNRSLPSLATLAPLWRVPDVRFISLQKGDGEAEAATPPAGQPLLALGAQLSDFAETAAVIESLDLVIAVDTSVAHLAGALGKPVWVLLPQRGCDWRWLADRDDSPWYPGVMRLFRQRTVGDWDEVLERVSTALQTWAASRRHHGDGMPGTSAPEAREQQLQREFERALRLHADGRIDEAVAAYSALLPAAPASAALNRSLGIALYQQRRFPEAIERLRRALQAAREASTFNALGAALRSAGRAEEALFAYAQGLQIEPDHVDLHFNRGNALLDLHRDAQALDAYLRAIELQPDHVPAMHQRSEALLRLGRDEEALASCAQVLALAPRHAPAHNLSGVIHARAKDLQAALKCFDDAIACAPQFAVAHSNRAGTLRDLGDAAGALQAADRALALDAALTAAWYVRGTALRDLNRLREALDAYDRALTREPGSVEVRWDRALALLALGEFEEGWKGYETRWQRVNGPTWRHFDRPLWSGGAALAGKTLLIWAEQGFGDAIQFCRYALLAHAQGASVVLEARPELVPLLRSLPADVSIASSGDPLPPFDVHCPLLSLPMAFGTTLDTIPATVPYLRAPREKVERWRQWIGAGERFKVGIAWSGNVSHANDAVRSIPVRSLRRLLDAPVEFHSVQKASPAVSPASDDHPPQIRDHSHRLQDFGDTAALVECMDLVISVDTSAAHVAGALGRPVWLLLPFAADFRWLVDRSDSPWYPSAALYRQPGPGDWDALIAQVAQDLARLLAGR